MSTNNARPYLISELPVETRVDNLVSLMTLEEKISQMVHDAPAIDRLGIPAYNWWNEGLHGVGRAGVATVFPQAIGLAATWNSDLMFDFATAVSDEARAKHHQAVRQGIRQIYTGLTYWSPNINIFRDPRWGRGQETYGEDPYLTTELGVNFVKALQGDDPKYLKLVATSKHFAVHSGPESLRHTFDAKANEKDMRETYLPQFEATIKEAGAKSVMGAYNRTNGEACCASFTLLEEILRQEWGFEGYIVSDCWAIYDIYANHKIVETAEEAVALAVINGCELNCGSAYSALIGAIEQDLISEAVIDKALKRLFTARFQLGMFDPPEQVPYSRIPYDIINSPKHQALALQAAQESIVLLKNDNHVLPLSKELSSIAVIGPNADELQSLFGNYNGTPAKAITPLDGLRQKVSPETTVYFAQGCDFADGIPTMKVIPAGNLRPNLTDNKKMGLTAVYYNNAKFEGQPTTRQVDPVVDFIWKDSTPFTGKWGDHFSMQWSGYLIPPSSGMYHLGVNGFSQYKLYLDDELLVEYEDIHHPRINSKEVELENGRFYKIKLEFVSTGLDPQIQLLWAPPNNDYHARAIATAEKADAIVAVMGLSPNLEGEELPLNIEGFAGGDRTDITLPRPQENLIQALHALGKPLVLVLLNGSALAVNWADEHIPAIIEAWYPGEAGGTAIADVLFGDYNPAGRLPLTFYKSVNDLPPFENYDMNGRTYRYFQGEALYPFGHGLSYTTFQYENLTIDDPEAKAGDVITIRADVTNTGDVAGDEVVQLYVRQTAVSHSAIKELKGFKRIKLQAGECKTVTFSIHINQLSVYDAQLMAAIHPGKVEIMVGSSSTNLPLKSSFDIVGEPIDVRNEKAFLSQVQVNT